MKKYLILAWFLAFVHVSGQIITSGPTVTNGAVNTAIESDPFATQTSLNVIGYNPDACVPVKSTGTDTQRGAALVAAYAAAKLLTPGGAALSATNRATVILPPGGYLLTATLELDTSFVDLQALFPESGGAIRETDIEADPFAGGTSLTYYRPPKTVVYMTTDTQLSCIEQTCTDTRLFGFGISILGNPTTWDAFGEPTAAFLIGNVNNAPSQYDTMYFWSRASYFETFGGCRGYWSFRGTWKNCIASGCSFRPSYGDQTTWPAEVVFSATMIDCQAGPYSFMGDGYFGQDYVARDSFLLRCRCLGTTYEVDADPTTAMSGFAGFSGCTGIGLEVESTVQFIDCLSGPNSFGVGNINAGRHIRCRAGKASFGGTSSSFREGTFSGYAEDCYAGANSFGGSNHSAKGKLTGTIVRCIGEANTQAVRCEGATIRDSRITTTTTGIHALQVLDSNTVVSNSDIIVFQGGTGLPVYAASAFNSAVYACRMNNSGNDADGLGANVTNTVGTANNTVDDQVE